MTAAWTLPELQDLLDEWLLAGWQPRPHDALRDPLAPRRALSPNEKYAALVAAAGYLPLTLTGEDYLELLPVAWRQINAYGIRIGYRTYDCPELGPYRLQHSGADRPPRPVGGALRPLRRGPRVRPDPGRLDHRRRGRTCR